MKYVIIKIVICISEFMCICLANRIISGTVWSTSTNEPSEKEEISANGGDSGSNKSSFKRMENQIIHEN